MAKQQLSIPQQLNETVLSVIGQKNLEGFEKAYLIANATTQLQSLLSPEYMKPIMALQGSSLGFKSDKVYPETVVKNCLIEAVLKGLQPHGNQFNIIAGNMYPTKEGLGYLLDNHPGLKYRIISELPRINTANTSAAIVMNIKWSLNNGPQQEQKIELPIKMNKFLGTDAVIGKATRKARKWLYETITGDEIPDGDVDDLDSPAHINNSTTADPTQISKDKEYKRISKHIENAKTLNELEQVEKLLKDDNHIAEFEAKKNELVFNDA